MTHTPENDVLAATLPAGCIDPAECLHACRACLVEEQQKMLATLPIPPAKGDGS